MRALGSTFLLVLVLLGASQSVRAANVTRSQSVQVTSVSGSKSASKGFFMFTTATSVAGCESGFWMSITDAGYGANLARVNDALVTKTPLIVAGDRDQIQDGSTDKVCRLTQLQ
jgi:hypothetical protein